VAPLAGPAGTASINEVVGKLICNVGLDLRSLSTNVSETSSTEGTNSLSLTGLGAFMSISNSMLFHKRFHGIARGGCQDGAFSRLTLY